MFLFPHLAMTLLHSLAMQTKILIVIEMILHNYAMKRGVKLFDYLIQFAHSTDDNELPVEYEPDLSKVHE